jgi:predicted ATPase
VLRKLILRLFKRFEDAELPFAPLTLLSGFNSGGKSSAVQGLVLPHLALSAGLDAASVANVVQLNGPGLCLGNLRTVVNEMKGRDEFTIGVADEEVQIEWHLGATGHARDSLTVPIENVIYTVGGSQQSAGGRTFVPANLLNDARAKKLLLQLAHLQFVPADRFGPSETYPLTHPKGHLSPGPRAERSFGNLHWLSGENLKVPALRHPNHDYPEKIPRQVEAWLAELFPEVVLETKVVENANLITLGIRTAKANEFHRPHNVGFGVTCALPVIIALLTTEPGGLVVIENPEVHLHPRAQARIGRLCAKAAASGVQVIVETHSDHVLNGMRLAVHDGELAPEDFSVLFFGSPADIEPVRRIQVDRAGRLDQWPGGFFDETEKLLDRLLEPVLSSHSST